MVLPTFVSTETDLRREKSARRLSESLQTNNSAPKVDNDILDEFSDDEESWSDSARNGSSVTGPDTILGAEFSTDYANLLLLVCRRACVIVWNCSDLRSVRVVARIEAKELPGPVIRAILLPPPEPETCTTSKAWSYKPLVAIATSQTRGDSVINIYSLPQKKVLKQCHIPGVITSLQSSKRHLSVSAKDLHILSLHNLLPTDFSPITDVAYGHSPSRAVPLSSLSMRFLVYASVTARPNHDGTGVLQRDGLERVGGAPEKVTTERSLSPRSMADNLYAGVKVIADLGSAYLTGPRSQTNTPFALSKSAPAATSYLPTCEPQWKHVHMCESIKVVDLKMGAPTVTFTPISRKVDNISISPCGSLVLCASAGGQECHIYEIGHRLGASPNQAHVKHRFRLSRGLTAAYINLVRWSADSKTVIIGTANGTEHVYYLPSTHQQDIEWGSTSVRPVTRIRKPSTQSSSFKYEDVALRGAGCCILVDSSLTLSLSSVNPHKSKRGRPDSDACRYVLSYYAEKDIISLTELSSALIEDTPSIEKLSSQVPPSLVPPSKSHFVRVRSVKTRPSTTTVLHIAYWQLNAGEAPVDTWSTDCSSQSVTSDSQHGPSQQKHLSAAELHSFTTSKALHLRSPYLSTQFTFRNVDPEVDFSLGQHDRILPTAPLQFRRTPSMMQEIDEKDAHYAMQTPLDLMDAKLKPSIPSFGNGMSGKHVSQWGFSPRIAHTVKSDTQFGKHLANFDSASNDHVAALAFETDAMLLLPFPLLEDGSESDGSHSQIPSVGENASNHFALDQTSMDEHLNALSTPVVANRQTTQPGPSKEDVFLKNANAPEDITFPYHGSHSASKLSPAVATGRGKKKSTSGRKSPHFDNPTRCMTIKHLTFSGDTATNLATSYCMSADYLAKYVSGVKGEVLRAKKKRKLHSDSSVSGSLAIIDGEAWDSSKRHHDEVEDEKAMVVESRSRASFKPVNPDLRVKTPELEGSDEEPAVIDSVPAFVGGLQTAEQLAQETRRRKKHEERLKQKALKEQASTQAQETVYRDSTGKARDTKQERLDARHEERKKLEQEMQRMEWGKGLVQREDKERRRREEEAMAAKPVARYADDEELNLQQKEEVRWNDPAARFLSKPSGASKKASRPVYKGPPPPPNRFGIMPGHRWDGRQRDNGFEKKFLTRGNEQKIRKDEAYKWSVDDM